MWFKVTRNLAHLKKPVYSLFNTCLTIIIWGSADFLGCYKDDKVLDDNFRTVNARALEYPIERFSSPQDCADQCGMKGFLYAGLQNGDLCFCGNYYDKYGRADDAECNIKCRRPDEAIEATDNPFESCGGRWTNAVYAGL